MSDLNPFSIEAIDLDSTAWKIDLGDIFSEIDPIWTLPEFDLIDLGNLFKPIDLGELLADFDLISIDELFPPDTALQTWLDDLTKGCDISLYPFDFTDLGSMARLWEGSDPCGNLAMGGQVQKSKGFETLDR